MPEDKIGDEGRYRKRLHYTPSGDLKYISPYDWEGAELQALQQRNFDTLYTQILDLTVAQTFQAPLLVNQPGRAICLYGIDTTNASGRAYNPVTNTGTEAVATDVFVFCAINSTQAHEGLALKHNRGFRGPFGYVNLSWPAQNNRNARLVIYRCGWVPWLSGEFAT